jgi:PIN domain nuclease of toxin-antitoxin system
MRLLLDTHVVLWQLSGSRPLGEHALGAIERASELSISVVSFAEMGIKVAVGKLRVPDGIYEAVLGSGLQIVGLAPRHGLAVAGLPVHHRDPFDRLLIAQAIQEGLTLVTADLRFRQYEVPVIDAAA